jgi:hypothetical protein
LINNGDRRFTYAEYKAWELDTGERYELIGGKAYAMAAPNDFHQAISVEILFPSNTSEEYVRKFNLYLKAGVREYWIVAPELKTLQVFELQEGAYRGTVYDCLRRVHTPAPWGGTKGMCPESNTLPEQPTPWLAAGLVDSAATVSSTVLEGLSVRLDDVFAG